MFYNKHNIDFSRGASIQHLMDYKYNSKGVYAMYCKSGVHHLLHKSNVLGPPCSFSNNRNKYFACQKLLLSFHNKQTRFYCYDLTNMLLLLIQKKIMLMLGIISFTMFYPGSWSQIISKGRISCLLISYIASEALVNFLVLTVILFQHK